MTVFLVLLILFQASTHTHTHTHTHTNNNDIFLIQSYLKRILLLYVEQLVSWIGNASLLRIQFYHSVPTL